MVLLNLDQLLELFRPVLMVRRGVMPFVHADLRIGLVAFLARHHEGRDARDVRLIRQGEQVVHQLDVLFELERDADRRRRQLEVGLLLLLGDLDAALDLADALEIVVTVVRSFAPSLRCRPAICLVMASSTLRSSSVRASRSAADAALAEHPLEHLARVDLHRHRRRRRPPRQRVHVDAAVVAVARADQARLILGGQLHRRQQRVLPDPLRGNLVGGDAGVGVDALRRLRPHPAQPRRRAQRVHRGAVGGAVAEPADDVEVVAERLERLQDRRELETRAFARRVHLSMFAPCGR